MYTERQHYPTAWQHRLLTFCIGLIIVQTAAFIAAETGLPWLPFGPAIHLSLLLIAGLLSALLWWSGLTLQVDAQGLALRFLPWQWQFRHIRWPEIRQLRLLPADERLPDARFGWPAQDFTHIYLLSSPDLRVLCIELVNGTRLYVSTERPGELLDFLQHDLVTSRQYLSEIRAE